ncbi:MAG: hypothetical protein ABR865_10825 [Terracidiphilus sp.]|jgi:hypothetical protein
MVTTAAESSAPCWALRDSLTGLGLFLSTACVVLWQNAHVAILWDTSYVLDSAVRFAHGQAPYRHFPFVHPPLTFLIQAAIIRFTGRVFFHHVLYAAAVGGLGTVLTWRLALASLRGRARAAWVVALLVAAPLAVLGIYSIIPIPEYDGDCAFWILVALWLFERADAKRSVASGLAAGVGLCVPLFAKQNMGLPFLAAAIGSVLLVLALAVVRRGHASAEQAEIRTLLSAFAGTCATLFAVLLALHWTVGIRTYADWTIRFAGERRLPSLDNMLAVFRDSSLLWTLPCVAAALLLLRFAPQKLRWTQIASFALLAAPFLFALASLVIYDDADERGDSLLALWPLLLLLAAALAIVSLLRLWREPSLRALCPLIVLAAICGTFMSQQLWGSTYAIWPLLVLLIADLLAFLALLTARAALPWFVPALACLISVTLLVCGGFYTTSEERLAYINLPDAPVEHSAFPQLAGMATPGPYLPEFDELLRYAAANIPQDAGLILIPGEDPFYFATGRVPRFPVLLFDPTTDPYSPAETAALVRSENIRWLIVKRDMQMVVDPTPNRAATMQALMGEFTLAAHLRGYDVYRR